MAKRTKYARIPKQLFLLCKKKEQDPLCTFYAMKAINRSSLFIDFRANFHTIRKEISVSKNSFHTHLKWLLEKELIKLSGKAIMLVNWLQPLTLYCDDVSKWKNPRFDKIRVDQLYDYCKYAPIAQKLRQQDYKIQNKAKETILKVIVERKVGKVVSIRALKHLRKLYYPLVLRVLRIKQRTDTSYHSALTVKKMCETLGKSKTTVLKYLRRWQQHGWLERTRHRFKSIGTKALNKLKKWERESEGLFLHKGYWYKQPCSTSVLAYPDPLYNGW